MGANKAYRQGGAGMKYKLLSSEELRELSRTADKAEIIERIMDILTELGKVTDRTPENT